MEAWRNETTSTDLVGVQRDDQRPVMMQRRLYHCSQLLKHNGEQLVNRWSIYDENVVRNSVMIKSPSEMRDLINSATPKKQSWRDACAKEPSGVRVNQRLDGCFSLD